MIKDPHKITFPLVVFIVMFCVSTPFCFYNVQFSGKETCHWVRASDIHKMTENEIEFTSLFTRQKVKGTHYSITEPIIPSFRKEEK